MTNFKHWEFGLGAKRVEIKDEIETLKSQKIKLMALILDMSAYMNYLEYGKIPVYSVGHPKPIETRRWLTQRAADLIGEIQDADGNTTIDAGGERLQS